MTRDENLIKTWGAEVVFQWLVMMPHEHDKNVTGSVLATTNTLLGAV